MIFLSILENFVIPFTYAGNVQNEHTQSETTATGYASLASTVS